VSKLPTSAIVALVVTSLLLAAGCQSAPSPAPSGSSGAPTGAAVAVPAASYRQTVVDAARAEGVVNATITSAWTPDGLRELEDAVEREFGVRLRVNFTPVGSYPQRVASLLTELSANTTPSFDLYQSSDASSLTLLQHDALDTTTWSALLPPGTPPETVQGNGALLVISTGHIGAMYDPNVVSDAEAPRSLRELAHAKWRGKLMLYNYGQNYLAYRYNIGAEPTLAAVRGAVRNGATADTYANGFTRYAAKEFPLVLTSSSIYHRAGPLGVPARFTSLDFSFETEHHISVARKAAHPNAARLLGALLASPEGQRIAAKYVETGNRYYESSAEYQLEQEARAAGLPSFRWTQQPAATELLLSPEGQSFQSEVSRILSGG
jgi:ABC-type Fe3+ transport system substrate-binding protein